MHVHMVGISSKPIASATVSWAQGDTVRLAIALDSGFIIATAVRPSRYMAALGSESSG